ncbi:RHS domain-containing protein [Delftia acidovorans]
MHHYDYHCDHSGTPIALTDRRGLAKLDPWSNALQ